MKRLLIDGTALSNANKGVGRYSYHLCLQVAARLSRHWNIEIATFSGERLPSFPKQFRGNFVEMPACSDIVKGLIWTPRLVRKFAPHVLLRPMDCVGYDYGVPTITVCHDIPDLIRRAARQGVPIGRRALDAAKECMQRHALRRSERVICNSRFTLERVAANCGIPRSSIAVGYCGIDPRFYEYARSTEKNAVRRKYGVERYVLTFVTGDYREGFDVLPSLVQALNRNDIRSCLLIAGVDRNAKYFVNLRAQLLSRNLIEGTHFVFEEFLDEDQLQRLAELYTAADFYLELSRHEGFGMQLAEAMACGTTCISTGAGALREVAGGYAIEVRVDQISDVVEALRDGYSKGSHIRDNRDQIEHTRQFNWDVAGALVTQCIHQLALSA